jgi:hypothetical protein
MTQSQLVGSYMGLGATDVAYQVMFETLDKDHLAWTREWDLTQAWSLEGSALRHDPRFGKLAERIGMVDYWKQYGFPDGCRAGADSPIVCS